MVVAVAAAAVAAPEKPTNPPPLSVVMAEPLFNAAIEKEVITFKENLVQREFFKPCCLKILAEAVLEMMSIQINKMTEAYWGVSYCPRKQMAIWKAC